MNWKALIVAALYGAVIASASAWQIQAWRYKATMAEQTTRHAQELATVQEALLGINEKAARQLAAHQEQQQKQATALANIDAQHYQELRRAQAENNRLRADIAAGRVRLPLSAVCTVENEAGAGALPGAADASGLDDGTVRAELHPEVAGRVVGIGGDADNCARKLTALQTWARSAESPP